MTFFQDQKVTKMILKVDLDCCQCYRKVKKVLCKFPQIRDQLFDKKNNMVYITVVCCSPEKIRDKLCCKAGESIKSIEIMQFTAPAPIPIPPPPPPLTPAHAPTPALEQKRTETDSKNGSRNRSKKLDPRPMAASKPHPNPAEEAPKPPAPAPNHQQQQVQRVPGFPPGQPPQTVIPVSVCCAQCYEGRPGGPCHGGGPGPGFPCGYYGRPCPCAPPPGYCVTRCDYFIEENPLVCSIM